MPGGTSRPPADRRLHILLAFSLFPAMWMPGCRAPAADPPLPVDTVLNREFLIVHSSFPIPRRHRLVDDLLHRRIDVAETLQLSLSDEPVHVYLFDNREDFAEYLQERQPNLAGRRAVFEETDTELRVFAIWGDRVAEDLRHEVTHGYLHGTLSGIPLWLDEGLAEYFETTRQAGGLNTPHVYQLATAFRRQQWTPNLKRLEQIHRPEDLTQQDYAEAWLWTHFLLHHSGQTRQVLVDLLAGLGKGQPGSAVVQGILNGVPEADVRIVEHLQKLARELSSASLAPAPNAPAPNE